MATSPSFPLEISVTDARHALEEGIPLVDLRTDAERQAGMAAGSITMTSNEVQARCIENPDWRFNLLCAGGARSLILAATLRRQGRGLAASVAGGFDRWLAAGLPVEHASNMGAEQQERYARHMVMSQVGPAGQERLLRSRVLLVGLGGLNSPAALYLAAAGVGTLGLADHDRVERSNLQRQILHGESSIGQSKTASARQRLKELNPDVQTVVVEQRLDANNAAWLVRDWDVIVDGTDNYPARYALNEACVQAEKPLVYGAVMAFQGQVSVFWPAGKPGSAPCLHCLLPESANTVEAPSCAEAGVLGVMPGIVGTLQATETLKLLLGVGDPLIGQLLMIDALTMDFHKTRIKPSDTCPVCA
ncbi:MAG: molybdopterin-synthase adenylyltransferase MoeB [Xanthomonadales bacterium]|jgi:molybdopterin/thiamine biosynthesis adenylyltransferase/rhodanese-related sulfurtransferase|nr:molybdopterin-synthase adenylyltransferase MoeB [Xanthomonadales bacterium]